MWLQSYRQVPDFLLNGIKLAATDLSRPAEEADHRRRTGALEPAAARAPTVGCSPRKPPPAGLF